MTKYSDLRKQILISINQRKCFSIICALLVIVAAIVTQLTNTDAPTDLRIFSLALFIVLLVLSLIPLFTVPFYKKLYSELRKKHSQDTDVISVNAKVKTLFKWINGYSVFSSSTQDICYLFTDKNTSKTYLYPQKKADLYTSSIRNSFKNTKVYLRVYRGTLIIKDFVILTDDGYKEINIFKN